MSASEILRLAVRAGIEPGCAVLDLCCGVAGPGRLITRELGCTYLGVDSCSAAIDIARDRARGLPCRFQVSQVPPVPSGSYDVVLLLETLLAFRDKETLLREVSSALKVGGRFLFTMEEGQPLTEAERATMPHADTVWLTPMPEMLTLLDRAGLRIRWQADCTLAHRIVADSLIGALTTDARHIAAQLGDGVVDELVTAHQLWSHWLASGRVRKFAVIAETRGTQHGGPSTEQPAIRLNPSSTGTVTSAAALQPGTQWGAYGTYSLPRWLGPAPVRHGVVRQASLLQEGSDTGDDGHDIRHEGGPHVHADPVLVVAEEADGCGEDERQ